MSSPFHTPDGPGAEGSQNEGTLQPRNPLLCFLCDDYYSEPCLLSCYHTFCSRCLRGKEVEGKINCPLCGQGTHLKEGATLPPSDILMRQLIELSNAENPPCANCDKRDKASMFFCSTCGQALCSHCRENTHRAKMFSSHEVVHMSKCSKEGHRRCAVHGEQYIMFSNSQKNMLCVNCFRDTPAEARLHCVDIDTAYTQGCKKLDRAIVVPGFTVPRRQWCNMNRIRTNHGICKENLTQWEIIESARCERYGVEEQAITHLASDCPCTSF